MPTESRVLDKVVFSTYSFIDKLNIYMCRQAVAPELMKVVVPKELPGEGWRVSKGWYCVVESIMIYCRACDGYYVDIKIWGFQYLLPHFCNPHQHLQGEGRYRLDFF